jgi:hypothetical protein
MCSKHHQHRHDLGGHGYKLYLWAGHRFPECLNITMFRCPQEPTSDSGKFTTMSGNMKVSVTSASAWAPATFIALKEMSNFVRQSLH